MKKIYLSLLMSVPLVSMAQNPVIRDQFSADPTARVFNNRVYLYPSHDIMPPADQRQDWFCMEDYHVFSSDNLTDWTDHGVIVTQNKVHSFLRLSQLKASMVSTHAFSRHQTVMPTSSGVQDVVLNSSQT